MRYKKLGADLKKVSGAIILMFLVSSISVAGTYQRLYRFSGGADGDTPNAGVVVDSKGNVYGTTIKGGAYGHGTVFKLSPNSHPAGTWTESVLYSFPGGIPGDTPQAGLIADSAGNLYGSTAAGGNWGIGAVFELTPSADGTWTEQVLSSFLGLKSPYAPVAFDAAGNLYGTTPWGGSNSGVCAGGGCGGVFQLVPVAGGGWTQNVLHNFNNGSDGAFPKAGLTVDPSGNIFGVSDGMIGYGWGSSLFELTPNSSGGWDFTVLHAFGGPEGYMPNGPLLLDAAGNLYGTDAGGGYGGGECATMGYGGCGTVYQLHPNGDGTWSVNVLYSFKGGLDGTTPTSGLATDPSGAFYGTAAYGGTTDCGTVFKLVPAAGGKWTGKVMHDFKNAPDGCVPFSGGPGVTLDSAGTIYGTTSAGGLGHRIVFKITP